MLDRYVYIKISVLCFWGWNKWISGLGLWTWTISSRFGHAIFSTVF